MQLFNYEESRGEIDFYLDNGFVEEARATVLGLLEKFPANTQVAELRRRVEYRARDVDKVSEASAWSSKQDSVPSPPREPTTVESSRRQASPCDLSTRASRSALSPAFIQPAPVIGKAGESSLHSLLDELGESESPDTGADDPDLHYNLGVAYHEMELLDEAIGEFQKAVKAAGKGRFAARHLEACSLLASCFRGKGIAADRREVVPTRA